MWSVVAYCDRNLCLKLKSQVINQPDDYKREKNCRKTDSKKPDIECYEKDKENEQKLMITTSEIAASKMERKKDEILYVNQKKKQCH